MPLQIAGSTDASREPETNLAEILYQITHVFLPPKVPQQDDTNLSHEMKLMTTVNFALRELRNQLPQDRRRELQGAIRLMENTIKAREATGALHPKLLEERLLGLDDFDSIAIHVAQQNAGLLVTRLGDDFVFESMELLARDADVTGCKGRLVRHFPGLSVGIKASVLEDNQFRVTLIDAIVKLDQEPASTADPNIEQPSLHTPKRDKIEDTAHPRLVTEMVMSVILAFGQPADSLIIRKNTREEVLLSQGHFPWRRSPLWLLIRVALQLTLERLANKFGATYSLYKHAMVYMMTRLLNMATEHGGVPHDTLYCMTAKISQRMLKLDPDVGEAWVAEVEESMKKTSDVIQKEWELTQEVEAKPLEFGELSKLNFERDTALNLHSLAPYLAQISSAPLLEEGRKQPDTRGHPFQRNDSRYLPRQNFTRDKDFLFLELADFEHSVAGFLGSYMAEGDGPDGPGTSGDSQPASAREGPDRQHNDSMLTYLPIQRDQVRLLRFKESFADDAVYLEMESFSISSLPEFRVMSYYGNDEVPSQSVIINQHPVRMTGVLYAALLGIRDHDSESPTWLWVESLCTDCSNMGERSTLVTTRQALYASSVEILVPLASVKSLLVEHAGLVFELSHRLSIRTSKATEGDSHTTISTDKWLSTLRAELDENNLDAATLFEVLVQIADDPWFSNPWAPQEVAFSNTSPLIMSGANSVHLAELCAFLESLTICGFISNSTEGNKAALASINTVLLLGNSRQLRRDVHHTNDEIYVNLADSLLGTLRRTLNYPNMLEPHDTIYSLVWLIETTDLPEELRPDYSLPFAQVFHQYAKYLIQRTGKIFQSYDTGNRLQGVPTWVPDFRQLHRPIQPAATRVPSTSFSADGKVMMAKGTILTEVAGVFPRKPSEAQARAQRRRGSESDLARANVNLEAAILSGLFGDWRHVISQESGGDFVNIMDDRGISHQLHHRIGQHVDFFATVSGHLGSSDGVEVGDVVAALEGAERPVLLRQCESYFRLVGTCALSGELGMEESIGEGRPDGCTSAQMCLI